MKFRDRLIALNACASAIDWVGDKSLSVAWRSCKQGDWMLWLAARVGVDRKKVVLAACECAELATKYLCDKTRKPTRRAIATARAWCRDEATIEQVRRAADAAYAAAAAADYAVDATYAAYAAADAAHFADDDAIFFSMRAEAQVKCATIARKHISARMISKALADKVRAESDK